MKLRLALATLLIAFFTVTLFGQATVASANHNVLNAVSAPITGPVSQFATSITGKVTLRYLGWFRGINNNDRIKPAPNVTIEARNIYTNEKFVTTTDVNGNYILNAKSGSYLVSAKQNKVNFVPGVKFVKLPEGKTKSNVNFQGLTR